MGCRSSTERASPGTGRGAAADFFTSTHKEQPAHPQAEASPVAPQESTSTPKRVQGKEENVQVSSGGVLSRANLGYNVAALATSSLVGLVQSIKDHVTKPTAMAQGRVAHLIEWKGWSAASQAGWDPAWTGEELYADLTDELKEARFAAGVAEQFAITEGTLGAWSSLDEEELSYTGSLPEVALPQALESLGLQENPLWGAGDLRAAESLQVFAPSGRESPVPNGHWLSRWGELPPPAQAGREQQEQEEEESAPGSLWLQRSNTLRYVDSSSLSEDDVFYN